MHKCNAARRIARRAFGIPGVDQRFLLSPKRAAVKPDAGFCLWLVSGLVLDCMVIDDYHIVMTKKPVRVAQLKARLSEYLRAVRRGADVTVYDRNEPIARLVPYAAADARLVVRERAARYSSLGKIPLPKRLKLKVDPVRLLLAERRSGR